MLAEDMTSQVFNECKIGSTHMTGMLFESSMLDHMFSKMGSFLENLGTIRTDEGFSPVNKECLEMMMIK